MVVVTAVPGPELRAQLVGLGLPPGIDVGGTIQDKLQESRTPPAIRSVIADAGKVFTPPAPPDKPTPWLLYGGIGVGVLLLGALLIRR